MRVLVTGGSGQVGSALRDSAPDGVVLRAPPSRALDIRNRASVEAAFSAWEPDLAVNAAAYTQVDRAEEETGAAMDVNATGAGNLAAACAASGCPLIHLSTDYVFDGSKAGPYLEDDAPAPLNAYGRSKLEGERAVRQTLEAHLILRISWVFGATGSNFVRTMTRLADSEEVRVVNDQHGTPCAASSVARAIWHVAEHWRAAPHRGTYHFASTPVTTWYEFAAAVYASIREVHPTARTPRLVPITTAERPALARRPLNSVLECARLYADFGLAAPDWRPALRAVVRQLLTD